MGKKEYNDYKSLIKKNKTNIIKDKVVINTDMEVGTIIFCLENEYYGIEMIYVKEIIKERSVTRLPKSLPYVKGLINLRGTIIPIIDLKKMFNFPSSIDRKVLNMLLILNIDDVVIGVSVDKIIGVTFINIDEVEPPSPLLGFINEKYIDGVVG